VEPTVRIAIDQPRSGGIAFSPWRKPWVKSERSRAAERRHQWLHNLRSRPSPIAHNQLWLSQTGV